MFKDLIDRFSYWFNGLRGDRPVFYLFGFCLAFLLMLWLCVKFIRFDGERYNSKLPQNIGKPSGQLPKDTLTFK